MIFPNETRAGMRAQTSCFVQEGDLPLTIAWLKDGTPLAPQGQDGVRVSTLDSFTSMLVIERTKESHTANYSCVATNAAKTAKVTAPLFVSGKL